METREDPRNVDDRYKYWTEDAIKADLREKCNNFSVFFDWFSNRRNGDTRCC